MTGISRVRGNQAGRVGSGKEVFKTSRVRPSRVKRFSNIPDRVGSAHEVI